MISRPMKHFIVTAARTTIFFLGCVILTGCNQSNESNSTSKQMDNVQAALKRVEVELTNLRQGLPSEVEQFFKELENRLKDPKQWPQDATDAEVLRQQLNDKVQALSPLAAERILPQLSRINWGVEALWNLRNHADAKPNQLEEAQVTIKEMLERYPLHHFPEIQKTLESRFKENEPKLRAFQVDELLKRAKLALEDKEDASSVFSSLQEFRGEKEVVETLSKLRTKVLEKNGLDRIDGFGKNLKKTGSFSDDRARQVSLLTIQEGLLRLTIDLELEEATPKNVLEKAKNLLAACDKDLLAIATKQQEENTKKVRLYQAWALGQIRKFDSPDGWYYDATLPWVGSELSKFGNATLNADWLAFQEFPSMKDVIQEKLGVDMSNVKVPMLSAAKRKEIYNAALPTLSAGGVGVGWRNNINEELAYRATRDGMVKFLLPIQSNLLDPPVAQLYQQAFSKGWQKLEGREDQLFVAQQSALVQKKTLEEVASSNP